MTEHDGGVHDRNNRQFFRVFDVMSIEYNSISEGDLHAKKREIRKKQMFETLDRPSKDSQLRLDPGDFEKKSTLFIARALLHLNQKMDELIALQSAGQHPQEEIPPIPVVLSASGCRFACHTEYKPGTFLHIVLHLNVIPEKKLDLLAEVVRNIDNSDAEKWGEFKHTVAVKFSDLREDAQEELVRYVFKIQRDGLRQPT